MSAVLQVLQGNPVLFIIVVGLFSLFVGSFLNVVIHRLPIMMENGWRQECLEFLDADAENKPEASSPKDSEPFNLMVPRSRCPSCDTLITASQNIPVLSYVLLKGKCGSCATKISAQYPLIELITMILSMVVAYEFGFGWQAIAGVVITCALVALSVIDLKHTLLPDDITLPLLWMGLLASLVPVFVEPQTAIVGAAAGYLSLWSVYWLFKLVTGKEGMGYGDFKLLAMFGAWLGWESLPTIILLSSVVGAVVGITLIVVRGRDRNIPIPFGPYLAAAGWLAMVYGDSIQEIYLP